MKGAFPLALLWGEQFSNQRQSATTVRRLLFSSEADPGQLHARLQQTEVICHCRLIVLAEMGGIPDKDGNEVHIPHNFPHEFFVFPSVFSV